MNILYSYSNCSDKKYKELFGNDGTFVLRADQKYHSLLIKGLAENEKSVRCLSGLPINRQANRKLLINEPDELENNVSYHYYKSLNLPVFRQFSVFCAGFFNVLFRGEKDSRLICDYQNLANAYGTLLAAKIKGIPTTVIVMDLPGFLSENKVVQGVYAGTFGLADGFIFLTEQMNEAVNRKNKPYIVIEGIADASLSLCKDEKDGVYDKKTVVYAGSIAKIYGIENLVKGFLKADIKDCELLIYGDGDYREELENICKNNKSVIYMGVCPNDEIVEIEKRASLLVNPRPAAPEYTKYSFPSKTIEYMASGTPVLTTKLPGIPEEYFEYLYNFESDDADGICSAFKEILALPPEELKQKGLTARDFVLSRKSGVIQGKRVIEFLEKRH